jgi:hypothetical protein
MVAQMLRETAMMDAVSLLLKEKRLTKNKLLYSFLTRAGRYKIECKRWDIGVLKRFRMAYFSQ